MERKGAYDKVAVGLEIEKQTLEKECDQYQVGHGLTNYYGYSYGYGYYGHSYGYGYSYGHSYGYTIESHTPFALHLRRN
jgi:hypothetical protein